jgi:hypothetical protein
MAYHIEQNPINGQTEVVIDGWEQGIADSPHFGLSDMRNVNNDSIPGIALCNYKLVSQSQASLAGWLLSASVVNNTVTLDTTVINGMPIAFSGAGLPTGITAGVTYYAIVASGAPTGTVVYLSTMFAINGNTGFSSYITITSDGTGAFLTINMGKPVDYAMDNEGNALTQIKYYILDDRGQVWVNYGSLFTLLKTSETSQTLGHGNGIVFYNK